jgi:multisubunit Na+/H+ antiporter MnhE subunit
MARGDAERDRHRRGPAGGGGAPGAVAAWVAWFAALWALWVVLANQTTTPELVAGAVAAVVGATAAMVVRGQRPVLGRPRAAWVLALWRPVAAIPRDLALLAGALAAAGRGRPPAGELAAVPFSVADDPRGAARRVLAVAAGSLSPNTIVLGLDADRDELVVHRLVARGDLRRAADPLELG